MATMQGEENFDEFPLPFSYSPAPSSCRAEAGTPHTSTHDDSSEDEFDLDEYARAKGGRSDGVNGGGEGVDGDGIRGTSNIFIRA